MKLPAKGVVVSVLLLSVASACADRRENEARTGERRAESAAIVAGTRRGDEPAAQLSPPDGGERGAQLERAAPPPPSENRAAARGRPTETPIWRLPPRRPTVTQDPERSPSGPSAPKPPPRTLQIPPSSGSDRVSPNPSPDASLRLTGSVESGRTGQGQSPLPEPSPTSTPEPVASPTPTPDGESDAEAPVLLSIGFQPQEVEAGSNVMLIVDATDNLTGVKAILGSVVSPSGKANLGVTPRPVEGTRFSASITVPDSAEAGLWYVAYLRLEDAANNRASHRWTSADAPARLSVRSPESDSQPPELLGVSLERASVGQGETERIFADLQDDGSGVASVVGVFKHARGAATLPFGMKLRDGGEEWIGTIAIPPDADCGDWNLSYIQAIDRAGNRVIFRQDHPRIQGVSFYLAYAERCDGTPPELLTLTLSPAVVENSEPRQVTITAIARDDQSGVREIWGTLNGPPIPSRPSINFSLTHKISDPPDVWKGVITLPRLAATGIWSVGLIQLRDQARNQVTVRAGDPSLSQAKLEVQ